MAAYKIYMSNLGHLRGINGQLGHHIRYLHRYIYTSVHTQKQALRKLVNILTEEDADICCFLEIDKGSSDSANFNQLEALVSTIYPFFDSENKYGPKSHRRWSPFSKGKSNAFIAKQALPFENIYFINGTKRLLHKILLPMGITLFFTHFSLREKVRKKQFAEIKELLEVTGGPCILMGDFNILSGFKELSPLLSDGKLRLLNMEDDHTFTFHKTRKALDLCLCSENIADRVHLKIVPQSFSDHAALVVEIMGTKND